jgi:hypothetical protein
MTEREAAVRGEQMRGGFVTMRECPALPGLLS